MTKIKVKNIIIQESGRKHNHIDIYTDEINKIINENVNDNYIFFSKNETAFNSDSKILVSLTFYHQDYLKELKDNGLLDTILKIKF